MVNGEPPPPAPASSKVQLGINVGIGVLVLVLLAAGGFLLYLLFKQQNASAAPPPPAAPTPTPTPTPAAAPTPTPTPAATEKGGVAARYVRFRRTAGTAGYVTILNVRAFDPSGAELVPAGCTMSPVLSNGKPDVECANATDGSMETMILSKEDPKAFLTVDYGRVRNVARIEIDARRDGLGEPPAAAGYCIGNTLELLDAAGTVVVWSSPEIRASQRKYTWVTS